MQTAFLLAKKKWLYTTCNVSKIHINRTSYRTEQMTGSVILELSTTSGESFQSRSIKLPAFRGTSHYNMLRSHRVHWKGKSVLGQKPSHSAHFMTSVAWFLVPASSSSRDRVILQLLSIVRSVKRHIMLQIGGAIPQTCLCASHCSSGVAKNL